VVKTVLPDVAQFESPPRQMQKTTHKFGGDFLRGCIRAAPAWKRSGRKKHLSSCRLRNKNETFPIWINIETII
jgi:hypothetical protein